MAVHNALFLSWKNLATTLLSFTVDCCGDLLLQLLFIRLLHQIVDVLRLGQTAWPASGPFKALKALNLLDGAWLFASYSYAFLLYTPQRPQHHSQILPSSMLRNMQKTTHAFVIACA